MTPENEEFLRKIAEPRERQLAALDPETRAFLNLASISPRGTDANGDWVFERSPAVQGDHGSYSFAVTPATLQPGYTSLVIADALFRAGWSQGAERVRSDLRRGLGIQ